MACTIQASQVFLSLQPEQQEALRRLGGLGKNNPSGILMRRIRSWFGYVDVQTCIASEGGQPGDTVRERFAGGAGSSSSGAAMQEPSPGSEVMKKPSKGEEVMEEPSQGSAVVADLGKGQAGQGFLGGHFKGDGKGSLTDAVPVSKADESATATAASSSIPPPKHPTDAEMAAYMSGNYYETLQDLWAGDWETLKKGDNVLWKGLKTGKKGQESTTYEFFNGVFHGFDVDREYVIIS